MVRKKTTADPGPDAEARPSPAVAVAADGDAPALRPATLAAQALGWWEPSTRGLVPAIHPATTYERATDGSYPGGRSYTRDENPTYEQAEALLAALEGGEEALLFASGMAAAAAVADRPSELSRQRSPEVSAPAPPSRPR